MKVDNISRTKNKLKKKCPLFFPKRPNYSVLTVILSCQNVNIPQVKILRLNYYENVPNFNQNSRLSLEESSLERLRETVFTRNWTSFLTMYRTVKSLICRTFATVLKKTATIFCGHNDLNVNNNIKQELSVCRQNHPNEWSWVLTW